MSRSYKKTPILKDRTRGMKNCANRKVRKSALDLPDGRAYRKVFPSYDICDWSFRRTKEEYRDEVVEAFLRSKHESGKYYYGFYGLEDVKDLEDFENLTIHEINRKINYNHWRKHYYSK